MKRLPFAVAGLLLAVSTHAATPQQPMPREPAPAPKKHEPKPTVFTEEMTWMEVRDALKAGKTTIIIGTGGVEQNGPYVITGKHNYLVRANAEAIARKLGNALVAPVIPFVPEGDISPPTGHMQYPGTISISEKTYEALLTDICASYRAHGFRDIILIGDSSGNQAGMKAVARKMNAERAAKTTRVHYIPEYYDAEWLNQWHAKAGIREVEGDIHDSFAVSAMLAAIDPKLIRAEERQAAGSYKINGINLAPLERTISYGRNLIEWYAETTTRAIQKAIAARGK